jgi:hypothetical protein
MKAKEWKLRSAVPSVWNINVQLELGWAYNLTMISKDTSMITFWSCMLLVIENMNREDDISWLKMGGNHFFHKENERKYESIIIMLWAEVCFVFGSIWYFDSMFVGNLNT